jgi:hypothetical protein
MTNALPAGRCAASPAVQRLAFFIGERKILSSVRKAGRLKIARHAALALGPREVHFAYALFQLKKIISNAINDLREKTRRYFLCLGKSSNPNDGRRRPARMKKRLPLRETRT